MPKIRFLKLEKCTDIIEAVTIDFEFGEEAAELRRSIQKAWNDVGYSTKCRVDSLGNYPCSGKSCWNDRFNELLGGEYCRLKRAKDLEQQGSHLHWLLPMLGFFWQNGIDEQAITFLNSAGFVYRYW